MARTYSSEFKSTLAEVSAPEAPLILLEITHPSLGTTVRICNDVVDVTSNSNLYIAMPFRCTLPDDFENRIPKATISIDNVSKDLMQWIESSNGAKNAQVRFIQIMRSRPNLIEWEITLTMFNVLVTQKDISAELGFQNLFSKPAINMQYRPENSPGVF